MKSLRMVLGLGFATALVFTSITASSNIVGYYNLQIYPGDNLVANQLNNGTNNLNSLLRMGMGPIPDGSTFAKWDSTANAYLPLSIYSADSDTWSINYGFILGEGGLLNSPSLWTNVFVGEVGPYFNDGVPRQINWNPNYADGLHLISCPTPFSDATFAEVVGRAAQPGEWVRTLNEATQTYSVTTFNGAIWDNGTPTLSIGESAWFNLGPVVPEPSTLAIAGFALAFMLADRRSKRSHS